jgi:hypothetical protein
MHTTPTPTPTPTPMVACLVDIVFIETMGKAYPFPLEEKRKIESVLDLFGSVVVVFHVIEVLALVDDMSAALKSVRQFLDNHRRKGSAGSIGGE